MNSFQLLRQKLDSLQTEASRIRSEGECLQRARLERSPAGGTASGKSQTNCKYGRLRAGKGKLLSNGSKSQYVPLAELGKMEAAIARGKELSKIEKQITALRTNLEKLELRAAAIAKS